MFKFNEIQQQTKDEDKDEDDRARLDAFLRRSKKYGYCADDVPTTVTDLFAAADQPLFKRVLNNELHVLQPLLPDKTINCYKLRPPQTRQTINT